MIITTLYLQAVHSNLMAHYFIVIILLLAGVAASIYTKKLTPIAAIAGGLAGAIIYAGDGYIGIVLLAAFFVLSTLASAWQRNIKSSISADYDTAETRKPGQVLANGGAAAIVALLALITGEHRFVLGLMLAGSLAAATADTLSSELGTVYGKRFYNIITFKRDLKGLDGVISLEGSFIGAAGAVIISVIWALGNNWNPNFWMVTVAGIIGNIVDSVLGATFERKGWLGNNMVNFLNTLTGAFVSAALWLIVNHKY
jgi:uncharacterized protein (TIGR00297 family)